MLTVAAVDYHTAGEPFRIVSGGVPDLRGDTILEKRAWAAAHLDQVRRLLVNEPRGHADMYGGFVTAPEDDGADLGVVFFHNAGYSTACGHGTIALVTWALETGVVGPTSDGGVEVVVDVPSGRVDTLAEIAGGRVQQVRFRNVPSYVEARGLALDTSAGRVEADLAFGGAFYACVDVGKLGLAVAAADLPALIGLGREIKHAIEADREVVHPVEPRLRDVYGVVFWQAEEVRSTVVDHDEHVAGPRPATPVLGQRNVTVFADGEVDRSPCGSGTSARLALLDADGTLPRGAVLEHRSIVDSVFTARVVGDSDIAGRAAVVTEVAGSAHLTGYHHFVLDPTDPIGTGFLLR